MAKERPDFLRSDIFDIKDKLVASLDPRASTFVDSVDEVVVRASLGDVNDVEEIKKIEDASDEIIDNVNHENFEASAKLAIALMQGRVGQDQIDSLEKAGDDKNVIIKTAVKLYKNANKLSGEYAQTNASGADDPASAITSALATHRETRIFKEFLARIGVRENPQETEKLTKRELRRRINQAMVAAVHHNNTDMRIVQMIIHTKGEHNKIAAEATDLVKTLPSAVMKTKQLNQTLNQAMSVKGEMGASLVGASPNGEEWKALTNVDVHTFYVSDHPERKKKLPVETSVADALNFWVGNLPPKYCDKSFSVVDEQVIDLEKYENIEDFEKSVIEGYDILSDHHSLFALDEIDIGSHKWTEGEEIDFRNLDEDELKELAKNFEKIELSLVFLEGEELSLESYIPEMQEKVSEMIKYQELEVFRKELFTSDYTIKYSLDGEEKIIKPGEEFVYEDLPQAVREDISNGKYRIKRTFLDLDSKVDKTLGNDEVRIIISAYHAQGKTAGEWAHGNTAFENMRELYDPYFAMVAKRAGFEPSEVTGFYGPDGISVGAYDAFVESDHSLRAETSDATEVDKALANYYRNFHSDLGDVLLTGWMLYDNAGRQVTQGDPTQEGKIFSRFWEQARPEAYDEAKGISDLYFRTIMKTLYPDWFGRISQKTAFNKGLEQSSFDVTDIVYPFGDSPDQSRIMLGLPELPKFITDKKDATKKLNALKEKQKYGVSLSDDEKTLLNTYKNTIIKNTEKVENFNLFVDMLMCENQEHFTDNRDELFVNYVQKTAMHLHYKGKSPEYIQGFLEKTTLGEIRSELPESVLDELADVEADDKYYSGVANKKKRETRSGVKYLRNIPDFIDRLAGSSDEALSLLEGFDSFETLYSLADEKGRKNLKRLQAKCPEMFKNYMGMQEYGMQTLGLEKIDYGESNRDIEAFFRYLPYYADVYKVAKELSIEIIQSIDPAVFGQLGIDSYKPEDPLGQSQKEVAARIKLALGITGDIMSTTEGESYVKKLPELIRGLVNAHASEGFDNRKVIYKHVFLFVDQMLETGLRHLYETHARQGEEMDGFQPTPADKRIGISLDVDHPDEGIRKVNHIVHDQLKARGFRVAKTKKANVLTEGGHRANSLRGEFTEDGKWKEIDLYKDSDFHQLEAVRPITQYDVLDFLKTGAISRILLMHAVDASISNDSIYSWYTKRLSALQSFAEPHTKYSQRLEDKKTMANASVERLKKMKEE